MPANFGQNFLKQRVQYSDLCALSLGDMPEFERLVPVQRLAVRFGIGKGAYHDGKVQVAFAS